MEYLGGGSALDLVSCEVFYTSAKCFCSLFLKTCCTYIYVTVSGSDMRTHCNQNSFHCRFQNCGQKVCKTEVKTPADCHRLPVKNGKAVTCN